MTTGMLTQQITVRTGVKTPTADRREYRTETIQWKATGRPAMTVLKARNRRRNKIARASRKANRG